MALHPEDVRHQAFTRVTTFQAKKDRLSIAARLGMLWDFNARVETKATKFVLTFDLALFCCHALSSSLKHALTANQVTLTVIDKLT